ncbi:MAG: HEPN domain-containing protein [Planctomycetaceae bacterium]|nr:HEPN domain-containing protein [Planctomycetaceae bacterium]
MNMRTPQEIESLAWDRLDEARILYENNKFDGAFYFAGYAVELILKVRICELFDIPNLFEESGQSASITIGIGELRRSVKIHNLQMLLVYSGLKKKFDTMVLSDPDFENINSYLIQKWSERSRYHLTGTIQPIIIQRILELLGDRTKGILQWLLEN